MTKKISPYILGMGLAPQGGYTSWPVNSAGAVRRKPSNDSASSGLPPWLGGDGTGWGDGGGGSGGGGQMPPSALWAFPQYSQTWAFTPPAPSGYTLPPAFDINSDTGYAAPRTSTSALSAVAKRAKSK